MSGSVRSSSKNNGFAQRVKLIGYTGGKFSSSGTMRTKNRTASADTSKYEEGISFKYNGKLYIIEDNLNDKLSSMNLDKDVIGIYFETQKEVDEFDSQDATVVFSNKKISVSKMG